MCLPNHSLSTAFSAVANPTDALLHAWHGPCMMVGSRAYQDKLL